MPGKTRKEWEAQLRELEAAYGQALAPLIAHHDLGQGHGLALYVEPQPGGVAPFLGRDGIRLNWSLTRNGTHVPILATALHFRVEPQAVQPQRANESQQRDALAVTLGLQPESASVPRVHHGPNFTPADSRCDK